MVTNLYIKLSNAASSFINKEDGITAIEYALIAAGIALVIIVGAKFLGGAVSNQLSAVGTQV